MRQVNVFSELVVPYPGETFLWVVNAAEIPAGSTSITVSSTDWGLTEASYVVVPGTGTPATADDEPGDAGTFSCAPPAPNVETQTLALAAQAPVSICSDVTVSAGEYFIWENATNETVTITPDDENENYWPLPGDQHEVPANGWLALMIPEDAKNGNYTLVVATANGGAACPQAAQPKIVVQ
jgi:hypothetical protein